MPLGRKILHVSTSQQAEQGWKKSAPKGPVLTAQSVTVTHHLCLQIPKEEERKKNNTWELPVYMCFELCLTHNQKAINLQRPQKYFYNN